MKVIKTCIKHGDLFLKDVYGKCFRCRLCQREWSKNNYNKNKEKILKRHSAYTLSYRKSNPDKVKRYNKTYWQKGIAEVNSNYVKDTLKRKSNLKMSEIPESLVEIKKQAILIKRKIKEINENADN